MKPRPRRALSEIMRGSQVRCVTPFPQVTQVTAIPAMMIGWLA
jgi:hypothetical protein